MRIARVSFALASLLACVTWGSLAMVVLKCRKFRPCVERKAFFSSFLFFSSAVAFPCVEEN